ncbi:MAG: leucine-rich repeat domain-containing protein [Candidatus Amulumruptor caecigallinarius]|nr:leucine-rich repeat domain-containing protein [Candidatus Amulumruptor caecigallinarius]MCM1396465.1 leucine-rich repeat domain-containing protein [Candidatus Amulumruptor caecigallinarius]MCM1453478.1 leucine-rich repeat domain-containing protein [bacterium]
MKITLALFSAALLTSSLGLYAKDVTLTAPGTLATAVGDDVSLTTLKVTGPVDAADFHFINSKLYSLQSLDLGSATVEAYSGVPVLASHLSASAAGELPEYALSGCRLTKLTLPEGLTAIGRGALNGTALSTVTLPESLRTIGVGAFAGSELTKLTVPAAVTVDSLAFSGCTSLKEVTYGPADVPYGAFKGCTSLSKFTDQTPLVSIGASAFAGCTSLTEMDFPATLTTIGASAFQSSGLKEADLSGAIRLKSIGAWAFAECPELTGFVAGPALTAIGEGTFFCDDNLASITLPEGLQTVPDYAFTNASALTDGTIMANATTSVGKYAYKGLTGIKEAFLSNGLIYIGDNAMEGMSSLETIHADEITDVPALGSDVWLDVTQKDVTLNVPDDLSSKFASTAQWREFHIEGPTAIGSVVADDAAVAAVTARFDGRVLVVEAASPLQAVTVALTDGKTFTRTVSGNAVTARIDTSHLSDNLYLVNVTLADGSKGQFKLVR